MYKVTVFDGENTATYIINGCVAYAVTAEADKLHYRTYGKHGIYFTSVEIR